MNTFTVYPAIDLRHGQVVRLRQGDATRQTTYGDDPEGVAREWLAAGATWLHVVNLDGAFGEDTGENKNYLQLIIDAGARVQFGGGLRSSDAIESVLEMGVQRVILGTAAVKKPELVSRMIASFGAQCVAVGIDARDGKVRVRGWTEDTHVDPLTLGKSIRDLGVETMIVTDISRDGLDRGVNLELAQQLAKETGLAVIAAGGVNSILDVIHAKEIGLQGIIIGRALYEGQVSLQEALKC